MKKFKFKGVRFSKLMRQWSGMCYAIKTCGDGWNPGEEWRQVFSDLRVRILKVVDGVSVGELLGLTRITDELKVVVVRLSDESDGPRFLYCDKVLDLRGLAQLTYK